MKENILMKSMLYIALLVLPFQMMAQSKKEDLKQFNVERLNISKKGMLVLGAWSIVNIGSGIGGSIATDNTVNKSFHQMNVLWGGVNFILAGVGYIGARNDNKQYGLEETFQAQHLSEKTYLFNAGLDLLYVTAGFYLKERGINSIKNADKLKGFGNSLIMQGAALAIFDSGMFIINSRHGKKLYPFISNIQLSQNGIGITWNI